VRTSAVCSLGALCAVAIALGGQVAAGHAQDSVARESAAAAETTAADATAAKPKPAKRIGRHAYAATAATRPLEGWPAPKGKGHYYVDFRARTAASYGHAYVWYGRSDSPYVDVAGLHPAGNEVPYILGHIIPVPAETGASYGDLDEQYVTAHYRVYMSEADFKDVSEFIRRLQKISLLWHAPTYNCQTFIGLIASHMGLKTPVVAGLDPEAYVNEIRDLNGGRRVVHFTANN
jgi:hypothetical protein